MIEKFLQSVASEYSDLRQDLHAHPELQFKEFRTSKIVADHLQNCGVDVTTGIAETGVIGTLKRGKSNRAIALRADMDALPIHETTGLAYTSTTANVMHACGHDGHTTALLAAAHALAKHGNFDGTVHFIFQPAEEDISGAKRMIEEGLFQRFPVEAVFGAHNFPGTKVGEVLVRPGAITAAVDIVSVRIIGIAGHGALPHLAADPIVAAASCVMALQTTVSRNMEPIDSAVVTVGAINGGVLATAIPGEVTLKIGVRTTSEKGRSLMEQRIPALLEAQAQSFGCRAEVIYGEGYRYPVGYNASAPTEAVRQTAFALGQSPEKVDLSGPFMFSEDFAYMLEEVPGCYFCIGNGNTAGLHDSNYNFNDELIVPAANFWTKLVERVLK